MLKWWCVIQEPGKTPRFVDGLEKGEHQFELSDGMILNVEIENPSEISVRYEETNGMPKVFESSWFSGDTINLECGTDFTICSYE